MRSADDGGPPVHGNRASVARAWSTTIRQAMSDRTPSLATPYRTHTDGELRASDAGSPARLAGWVHRRRDHGQLIFLDLRDRHGLTQVVIDQTDAPAAHEQASRIRPEYVVTVARRGRETPARDGEPEAADRRDRAPRDRGRDPRPRRRRRRSTSTSRTRRSTRSCGSSTATSTSAGSRCCGACSCARRSCGPSATSTIAHGFVEIETPTLIKSTPEGARDFIVPSRLQPGSIYALPQSPQQLKQLLMVAGIDRYFQIARCYRDEDPRGDRQPEFSQLDLEMSFVDEATVMGFVEAMVIEASAAAVPERPIQQVPFPVFTYDEVIERFGSDKPDLRFGDGAHRPRAGPVRRRGDARPPGSGVFDETLAAGGRVKAIVAPGMAGVTRREIDELTERAKRFGGKGLAHLALEPGGEVKGPIAKFLSDETQRALIERTGAAEGDLILIVADAAAVTADVLGRLRVELGERLGLADPTVLAYAWVHRFPMYQWDVEGGRWDATHNPFSRCRARRRAAAGHHVGRSRPAVARRSGRPSPGAPVRPGPERLGAGRRVGADPSARPARAELPAPGPHARGHAREVRGRPRGLRVRRPAARRHRPRDRPLGGPARGPADDPRGHGLPEDPVRERSHARGPVAAGAGPATRSSDCASSGSRAGTAAPRRMADGARVRMSAGHLEA